jgi:tetratricopeptide (TPR) repeat protein
LAWAKETDLEAGLYLSSRLIYFVGSFGTHECLFWLTEFIQNPKSQDHPHARARALLAQGRTLWYLQQFERAHFAEEQALALFRNCGDQPGEVDCLLSLGGALQFLENMERKTELHEQALALARSINDVWMQASALEALSWDKRNPGRARVYREEAVALFRQVSDWRNLAFVLSLLGEDILQDGDTKKAQEYLDESLALNQRMLHKWEMEFVLTAQARMALMRGDFKKARALLQECGDILDKVGNRMGHLWARARLGHVMLCQGKIDEAHIILDEVVREFYTDQNKAGLAFALEKKAGLFIATGKPERAACLIGWAEATRANLGDVRPRLDQIDLDRDIDASLAKMGQATFEEACNKGRAMTAHEVVVYALSDG